MNNLGLTAFDFTQATLLQEKSYAKTIQTTDTNDRPNAKFF